MEVAFYHDDPSNRISAAYDSQSSPGSVDSINSTDAGPVTAIPPYRDQRFGQDYDKTAALKGMNLQVHSNPAFSPPQHPGCNSDSRFNNVLLNSVTRPNSVPGSGYNPSNVYAPVSQPTPPANCVVSTNNLSLAIPESSAANTSTLSTPDIVNMMKGASEFDQMLPHYSQNNPHLAPHIYSREPEMYGQVYHRDLLRQKTHNGSNSDLATSSGLPTGAPGLEGSPCSAVTSGTNVVHQQPHHFVSPDPYFAREGHLEGPSTSVYGAAVGSTIHHMGNPAALHPGHPLLMSPHSSVVGHLKEEMPQTVPVISKTPPLSPIDMEHQELIKTERKRMRNRLAASKCRKRKLERISRLEEKVNNLKTQNLELSTNANLLRQQVADLKSKVMTHVNSGCQLMMSQQQVTF